MWVSLSLLFTVHLQADPVENNLYTIQGSCYGADSDSVGLTSSWMREVHTAGSGPHSEKDVEVLPVSILLQS